MSSESELRLLEGADIEFPVEIDAHEIHANAESDEELQSEQDKEIQDPED